jgi:TonB family protein
MKKMILLIGMILTGCCYSVAQTPCETFLLRGENSYKAGDFNKAKEYFNQGLKNSSCDKNKFQSWINKCNAELAKSKSTPSSGKSPKQIQCEQRYKDGKEAFDEGDYETALLFFNKGLEENCTNVDFADYIEMCNMKIEKRGPLISDADRLKITNVTFAYTSFSGQLIYSYNAMLYDTTLYLSPKITYDNLQQSSKSITLYIKIINPDEILLTEPSSPNGYSYARSVNLAGKNKQSEEEILLGWGDSEKKFYSTVGTYTFEIWCAGKKIYSAAFDIYPSRKGSLSLSATEEVDEIIPFVIVEEKPKFQGKNANEFVNWIYSKLENNYPQEALENNLQGTVRVSFTVNTDGTLSDIRSMKKVDSILENCVIELVKKSPKWTPGRQQNKPVKVPYQILVIFKIGTE